MEAAMARLAAPDSNEVECRSASSAADDEE